METALVQIHVGKKIAKYMAILRMNVKNRFAHAAALFSRIFLIVMRVWVLSYLYTAIYHGSVTTEINQLTMPMVIWSVMLAQAFQTAARPAPARAIEDEIKSGLIAYSISKPYSYLLFHYFTFLGTMLPVLGVSLITGFLTAYLLVGGIAITIETLVFGTIALFLGYTIEYLIFFCIGIFAFWLEDIGPILWNYQKAQLLFSGMILPVALFPKELGTIVEYLPLTQIYYGPARLLVRFDSALFSHYLSIQLVWIFIFIVCAIGLFHKAKRHVSINAG